MSHSFLIKPQTPARQSNFELMRIFFMALIVVNHLRGYGGLLDIEGGPFLSRTLLTVVGWGGKTGVNGFVLLSGYFMCKQTGGLRPKRLLKLFLQVFFFSAGLYLFNIAMGREPLTLKLALRYFLPLSGQVYWFATTYFILMLLAPFLNLLIAALDRKQYRLLLAVSLSVFCVIPSFYQAKYSVGNVVWFVVLYLVAGYIRLHPSPWFEKKWPALGLAAVSYVLIVFSPRWHTALAARSQFVAAFFPASLRPQYMLPVFLCALGCFLFFKNLKIKPSRVINIAASGMFGVYLFHEHSLMRDLLWLEWFDCRRYFSRPLLFCGRALLACAAVFALGLAIDLIRQYALELPLFKLIDRKMTKHE